MQTDMVAGTRSDLLRVVDARFLQDEPSPPEADPPLRGTIGAPLPGRLVRSTRVLAIAILDADLEGALELAAPIVDSIEFFSA